MDAIGSLQSEIVAVSVDQTHTPEENTESLQQLGMKCEQLQPTMHGTLPSLAAKPP
jgi:hypothetical protein